MRAWTQRHPNVMVVWWAILVVGLGHGVVGYIDDHDWFYAVIYAIALGGALGRLEHWWHRT